VTIHPIQGATGTEYVCVIGSECSPAFRFWSLAVMWGCMKETNQ